MRGAAAWIAGTSPAMTGWDVSYGSFGQAVRFDDDSMWVELSDGRTIGVPYAWFPCLLNASRKQRQAVEIGRFGLHWEAIDEDVSIAGLLAGRRDQTAKAPPAEAPKRRKRA